jgi:hypothetical protein
MDKKRIQHQINLLLAQKRTYSRENNKLEKQIGELNWFNPLPPIAVPEEALLKQQLE